MRTLQQSTAYNLVVFMTDSADHISGKTGLTLTITASKDGGSFASISPTVTELSNGWYKLALTTSHTDTEGDLALHITGTGADPTDLAMQVRPEPLEVTIADSIPADGSRPSVRQGIYMIVQFLLERTVSGTTETVKKPDGSTTLFTSTLNDATNPTSRTRST